MAFTLSQYYGFSDIPDAALTAGNPLGDFLLAMIAANAKAGAAKWEIFYGEFRHGDTVPLYQSDIENYQYSRAEQIHVWNYKTTTGINGAAGAPGGHLMRAAGVDPSSGKVISQIAYYVQSGAQTNTNDGMLAVWTFTVRGRGDLSLSAIPSYTDLADTTWNQDAAVAQTILRQLKANSALAGVRSELFLDNASGAAAWAASTVYALGALVKPTKAHQNGYWYKCISAGTSATTEPAWPGAYLAQVRDGSTLVWQAVDGGYANGQAVPLPVSAVDGYAYARGELTYIPFWLTTGKPDHSGTTGTTQAPGAARIRLLNMSVNSTTGVVTSQVNYWDGTHENPTNDGRVMVLVVAQRALAMGAQGGANFTEDDDTKFFAQATVGDTYMKHVNQNAKFSILRPEVDSAIYVNGNTVALPVSPVDSYAYVRNETIYLPIVLNTGAGQGGIRSEIVSVDPLTGLVTSEVDFEKNEGGIAQGFDANVSVFRIARRKYVTPLAIAAAAAAAGASGRRPSGNLVENGGFERWSNSANVAADGWYQAQLVGNASSGRVTGIVGDYSQGLTVSTAGAGNSVSAQSVPIAVRDGDSYIFSLLAQASVAITAGFYIRIHLLNSTLASDVYFDLVANGALGTTVTRKWARFTVPPNGATTVSTSLGSGTIVGTLNFTPAFVQIELFSAAPNVATTISLDSVQLRDIQEILDSLTILGNVVGGTRLGGDVGPRAFGAATNMLGWEITPASAIHQGSGPVNRIAYAAPSFDVDDTNASGRRYAHGSGLPAAGVHSIRDVTASIDRTRLSAAAQWGFFGAAAADVELFGGTSQITFPSATWAPRLNTNDTSVGGRSYGFISGGPSLGTHSIRDNTGGADRTQLNATPQWGFFGAPGVSVDIFGQSVRSFANTPHYYLSDTTPTTGRSYEIDSGAYTAGVFTIADNTASAARTQLNSTPQWGFFGAPAQDVETFGAISRLTKAGPCEWNLNDTLNARSYGLNLSSAAASVFSIKDVTAGVSRTQLNTIPQWGFFGAPTVPVEVLASPLRVTSSQAAIRVNDTTPTTGRDYGFISGLSGAGEQSITDLTASAHRTRLNTTPQWGFFGAPAVELESFGQRIRASAGAPLLGANDTNVSGRHYAFASGFTTAGVQTIEDRTAGAARQAITTDPAVGFFGAPSGASTLWHAGVKNIDASGNLVLKNITSVPSNVSDQSTTSLTYVDLPNMTKTITTKGNLVLLIFACQCSSNTAGWGVQAIINKDGAVVGDASGIFISGVANEPGMINISWLDTPTAASHTYKIQFRAVTGGTATVAGHVGQMQIVELG